MSLMVFLSVAIGAAMLGVLIDQRRRLEALAITDPLTGAYNRRHMDVCLATSIERRKRTTEPSSLLMIDVDHFKQINDRFGHAAGDRVLKTLVALVSHRARCLDALFRVGGEEFVLLLAGARYVDAVTVAEDLRALVAGATLVEGMRVSISIGVSELRWGQSAASWFEDADRALYRAKRGGRNRVAGPALAASAS